MYRNGKFGKRPLEAKPRKPDIGRINPIFIFNVSLNESYLEVKLDQNLNEWINLC